MKKMAIEYTSDYEAYDKNELRLQELLHTLYAQKAEKLKIQETLLEKRMNERRLDAIVSNVLVLAQRIDMQSKMGEVSNLTKQEFENAMEVLKEYFIDVVNEDRALERKTDVETDKDDDNDRKSTLHEGIREHIKRAAEKVSSHIPSKKDKRKENQGRRGCNIRDVGQSSVRSVDRDR